MWLLDVNLPTALLGVLRSRGIDCDTAASRGWRDLTNGLLAEAAFRAGFRVILTRDRGFGESAARALRLLPELLAAHLSETSYVTLCWDGHPGCSAVPEMLGGGGVKDVIGGSEPQQAGGQAPP